MRVVTARVSGSLTYNAHRCGQRTGTHICCWFVSLIRALFAGTSDGTKAATCATRCKAFVDSSTHQGCAQLHHTVVLYREWRAQHCDGLHNAQMRLPPRAVSRHHAHLAQVGQEVVVDAVQQLHELAAVGAVQAEPGDLQCSPA